MPKNHGHSKTYKEQNGVPEPLGRGQQLGGSGSAGAAGRIGVPAPAEGAGLVVPSPDERDDAGAARRGGPVAPAGTHDRPDLGAGFHDVAGPGLSFDCAHCGCTKHCSTRQLGELCAAARLRAWGAMCPGQFDNHRQIGKRLLFDLRWADPE